MESWVDALTHPIDQVVGILPCGTPDLWFRQATQNVPLLLIDHANCEKKAAGTALSLMFRYVGHERLMQQLSRLAREELKHFEDVHRLLTSRGIEYRHLSASRYASALRAQVRTSEPQRLTDMLLTSAIVEARSCERFLGLCDVLPLDLAGCYAKLLESEARHYQQYLGLAERYAREDVSERFAELLAVEASLVTAPDTEFRFHSGPIVESTPAER